MKSFLTKIKNWWRTKNAVGKILTVISCLAAVCILTVAGLFASAYAKDAARRRARQAATEEELLKGAITEDGVTYVRNPNVMTFLFLGIDNRTEAEAEATAVDEDGKHIVAGQSDAVMLAAFDMEKNTVKVVNVPRDSMVDVQEYELGAVKGDVVREQITLQYAQVWDEEKAAELVKDVISTQIFDGLYIDYYAAVNFAAIPKIVDDIGGLDVAMSGDYDIYVFNEEGGIEPRHYDAGRTYHLYGYDAAGIAHYRDIETYGSAFDRIERQKDFIKALYRDGKEAVKKDPALIAKIYGDVKDDLNTDITLPDMISLAKEVLDAEFSTDEIAVLPGEIGTEPIEGEEDHFHQTYELDMDGVRRIMLDTWYVPLNEIQ